MDKNGMFIKPSELSLTDEEVREMIFTLQAWNGSQKLEKLLDNDFNYLAENIIVLYLYYAKRRNYKATVKDYKEQYIDNEALIEPGVTREERLGLADIYDYIRDYDFSKMPNVVIESFIIHNKLYSHCPYPEYGGKLRDGAAIMKEVEYDVMDAKDAIKFFQSFISKKYEIDSNNILDYIDEVIKDTVDLIKCQPFPDGNKRTFRALLNLMLGKIGIPPLYFKANERKLYHDKLMEAIEKEDYKGITRLYYYKICDAIVEFDLMNQLKTYKEGEKQIPV